MHTAKINNVMDRIKTVDDVLYNNGLTPEAFGQYTRWLKDDEMSYIILKLVVKSLNEGWVPNWDDDSQGKYYPWFYMEGGYSGFRFREYAYWYSYSSVGSRLCFKSRELAEYAGRQFIDVYKRFMII